jgi:hypothetical protein
MYQGQKHFIEHGVFRVTLNQFISDCLHLFKVAADCQRAGRNTPRTLVPSDREGLCRLFLDLLAIAEERILCCIFGDNLRDDFLQVAALR